MTQFAVHPTIQLCDTCQELANTYDLGPQDLLFTNDFLFDPYFAPLDLKCPVLFQEKYGLGEPTDEMVEAIYRDMPKDITRIVAVGGGTVLDVAKILSLRHVSPILDLYDGKLPVEKGKELILVPTTCGTGTEVTNISILALVSRRTKKGLANDAMYADQAVLIPELLGTPEGREKLEQELHYLETEKRAEVGERIKVAREFGDISENSEYDDAKNEQGMVEARIAEINQILSEATIVDTPKKSNKVTVGAIVDGEHGRQRARIHHRWRRRGRRRCGQRFPTESPVGAALLGHKKDDEVTAIGPTGREIKMTILKTSAAKERWPSGQRTFSCRC